MAITKIHPIKSTLNLAIDYITKDEKTDDKVLVSSFMCNPVTAHLSFKNTREENNSRTKILAQHLIQSFYPGEADTETAHRIGQELCKRYLKDEYEYVIATHIDRDHIHNHIIFNHVNMITGKCYRANYPTYHQIRETSDELCKENNLLVIDEHYESYKRKYKTRGKSWYEHNQYKKGKSWKARLQFDIDRMINKAESWDDFLRKMASIDYEINHGKYIAFRHKDKQRFTRAKTIGPDYTENKLKERIQLAIQERADSGKKRVGNVINISTNEKAHSAKAYEMWARKHNIKAMSESIIGLREQGINSAKELEELIEKTADERQNLQEKIKVIENEMADLACDMENVHTINQYRQIYKYMKKNPSDKKFEREYHSELTLYKTAAKEILTRYEKLPDTKDILRQLDELETKKTVLMEEYSSKKEYFSELNKYKKNYENYYEKEVER